MALTLVAATCCYSGDVGSERWLRNGAQPCCGLEEAALDGDQRRSAVMLVAAFPGDGGKSSSRTRPAASNSCDRDRESVDFRQRRATKATAATWLNSSAAENEKGDGTDGFEQRQLRRNRKGRRQGSIASILGARASMCSEIEEIGKGHHKRTGDGARWPSMATAAREKGEARWRRLERNRDFRFGEYDLRSAREGRREAETETARQRRSPAKLRERGG